MNGQPQAVATAAPRSGAKPKPAAAAELSNPMAELAASRLNYAGYETQITPADRQDYSHSTLVDLNAVTDADRNSTVLAILGLQPANLASLPDANSPVDYRLILGADYNPCFSPEGLSH